MNHYELTDDELEKSLSNCTLNVAMFSHEAHLRLAWIYIKKYGEKDAIDNLCKQIKKFAESVGAEDKYNETVTIAAVKAVHHFIKRTNATGFKKFIEENVRLKNNFKALLSHHYRTDIFNSPEATQKYLEPELLPFD